MVLPSTQEGIGENTKQKALFTVFSITQSGQGGTWRGAGEASPMSQHWQPEPSSHRQPHHQARQAEAAVGRAWLAWQPVLQFLSSSLMLEVS